MALVRPQYTPVLRRTLLLFERNPEGNAATETRHGRFESHIDSQRCRASSGDDSSVMQNCVVCVDCVGDRSAEQQLRGGRVNLSRDSAARRRRYTFGLAGAVAQKKMKKKGKGRCSSGARVPHTMTSGRAAVVAPLGDVMQNALRHHPSLASHPSVGSDHHSCMAVTDLHTDLHPICTRAVPISENRFPKAGM